MSKQLNLFSYFGGQKVVNSVNTTVNEIQDLAIERKYNLFTKKNAIEKRR